MPHDPWHPALSSFAALTLFLAWRLVASVRGKGASAANNSNGFTIVSGGKGSNGSLLAYFLL